MVRRIMKKLVFIGALIGMFALSGINNLAIDKTTNSCICCGASQCELE